MRARMGNSFVAFFGLTLVNTGDQFLINATANIIKEVSQYANLLIVRSDMVHFDGTACNPHPLSTWKLAQGDHSATASTIMHSKLLVASLTDLEGTILAMSSSLALRVYIVTQNRSCKTEIKPITEVCNQKGFEGASSLRDPGGKGALFERYSKTKDVTLFRTYESELTILETITAVVSDMPKNSKALFGWALVDMNFEDSSGQKCLLYALTTDAFARTAAVRQTMGRRQPYRLRQVREV
ncbi:uncharacterized protein LOC144167684 [Haemaphysalis longicornis]